MKRFESWHMDTERKLTFGSVLLLQIVALFAIFVFFDIKYEVSDDFVMEMILSGTYTGKHDVHIMFSNILWAAFLLPLYKMFASVSWYFVGQIIVCFVSLLTICYVLSEVLKKPIAVALSILITVYAALDIYVLPQFTKTAISAVLSGSLLFLWNVFSERKIRHYITATVLVLIGSWIRISAIYIVAPFILVIIIYEIGKQISCGSFSFPQFLKEGIVPGLCLIFVVFLCAWFDGFGYSSNDEYSYYRQYSTARATIVDYAWPSYVEYEDEFQNIGVSENDYRMITGWNLGDSDTYSLELLEEVGEIVKLDRGKTEVSERQFITVFKNRQLRYSGAVLCIVLGLLCIFIDWKKTWIPIVLALICGACFFYYYYLGRMVYRVEFGYYFCAAVLIAFYSRSEGKPPNALHSWGTSCTAFLLSAIIILAYVQTDKTDALSSDEYRAYVDDTFYYSWNYDKDKYGKVINEGDIRPNFLREVREHPENMYVMEFYTTIQTFYYDFSPFESAKKSFPSNVVYLGGVTVNHPSVVDSLYHEDTGKLLEKLLDDKAYLVTNRAQDMILTYFIEHGHPNVRMELYDTIDGYNIWKYIE